MLSYCIAVRLWLLVLAITFFMSSDRFHASVQLAFYLFVQVGKTALHEAAITGNAEMVAYMMEQVNPNVDARDVVSRPHSTLLYLFSTFVSTVHELQG